MDIFHSSVGLALLKDLICIEKVKKKCGVRTIRSAVSTQKSFKGGT
jgi:hypothetical protein